MGFALWAREPRGDANEAEAAKAALARQTPLRTWGSGLNKDRGAPHALTGRLPRPAPRLRSARTPRETHQVPGLQGGSRLVTIVHPSAVIRSPHTPPIATVALTPVAYVSCLIEVVSSV